MGTKSFQRNRRACLSAGTILSAAALLAFLVLPGCGKEREPSGAATGGKKIQVVATLLPIYVLALDVIGDSRGVELSMLLPAGAGCPHDYALSPGEVEKLAHAQMVLANGAGLEEFLLSGPVKQLGHDLRIVYLSEGIPLIQESTAFGDTQAEKRPGHAHAGEYNEHTFASPRNAARMVRTLAEVLAKAAPANAEVYRRNAAETARKLDELADAFIAAVKTFPNRKIVTIHNVFAYLARDCGLRVVAVIEQEPGQAPGLGSFADLVRKVKEEKPAAIFYEPQYSPKPAETLSRETGVPVYSLDPFVTGNAARDEYLAAMQKNLETLRKSLGVPRKRG